ncbi:hypothetical protein [Mucilaginibacter sp. 22184]|uniref:hypothetical protein n=1 Tax=Mucilaginibacter sp. 22184 TaxID=3453887 RepID=UPI003F83032A
MDYLQKIANQFGCTTKSQEAASKNFNEKSFRALIIDNYKSYQVHIDEYGLLFSVRIIVFSDFTLSVNNPDQAFAIDRPVNRTDTDYDLFLLNEKHFGTASRFKYDPFLSEDFNRFWPSLQKYFHALNLADDEAIIIRENGMFLTLQNKRDLVPIINETINLINESENIFVIKSKRLLSSAPFPDKLKPLLPFLKKWGVPDEHERRLLITNSRDWQKARLIRNIAPLQNDIETFLKSIKNGRINAEVLLLRNLSKLVSELKIEK